MAAWFHKLICQGVLMVGEYEIMFLYHPGFLHQEIANHQGLDAMHFEYSQIGILPAAKYNGFLVSGVCPQNILEEVTASKVLLHGDHVQRQVVGANARIGVAGVRSLHRLVWNSHLLIFSEVVMRLRTHSTVLPIGEPTSWEVRRTRMLLSKSPHTTMLPAHRGIMDKGEHRKHIKSFASSETMQKDTFEHETHSHGMTHG